MGTYIGGYVGGAIDFEDMSGEISMTYVPEDVISDYTEKNKEIKLDDDGILFPKYITTDNVKKELKEEDYIGKTVEFTISKVSITYNSLMEADEEIIEEKTYTFKIAGLYDNLKSGMDNSIIASNNVLMEAKYYTQMLEEDGDVSYAGEDAGINIYVTIDDYENAEEIEKSIDELLEDYSEYALQADSNCELVFDTDEFRSLQAIQLLANLVASFLFVCAVLSLYSYIKDMLDRRKQEFGIMKAIGYKTSGICKTLIKELALEIVIPLACAFIFGTASVIVMDNILSSSLGLFDYSLMTIKLYGSVAELVSAMAVGLPLLGYVLTVIKISRLEPMEALK